MLIGASNCKRLGWLRNTCLAVMQSCRISGSISWIFFPLFFLPSISLSISPSNPSIPTAPLLPISNQSDRSRFSTAMNSEQPTTDNRQPTTNNQQPTNEQQIKQWLHSLGMRFQFHFFLFFCFQRRLKNNNENKVMNLRVPESGLCWPIITNLPSLNIRGLISNLGPPFTPLMTTLTSSFFHSSNSLFNFPSFPPFFSLFNYSIIYLSPFF